MRNRPARQGFTLVEVAVAIFIVALAVLGVTMIVTQTIRANLSNQQTIEATQIAERLIEQTVASLRDDPETLTCPGATTGTEIGESGTEYDTLLELTPLILNLHTGQYSEAASCASTDLFQVDVTVAWEGGENVHLSTLTSSDPTYEAHPVVDRFFISDNDDEHDKTDGIGVCANALPGRVTLDWTIYGAATITLQVGDAEPFEVDFVETRSFDLTETTVFTLSATNIAGITVKEQRTAVVDTVPLLNAFAFNPNPTLEGVPSTLSWATSGAQAVFLDDEPVLASGTRPVQPIDGTLATLRLVNGACSITEVISAPLAVEPLEILDFKPDRDTVTAGESVTLGWTYNHAISAAHHVATLTNSRDGATLDVTDTTYQQVTVEGPTTYTLTVTDKNGRVLATATTTVDTVAPARIDAFDAAPAQVCGAQPITVTWSASSATRLTLMPMGVDVTGANSHTLPIDATQAVYLVAENEAGHKVESQRVTITHVPTPNPTFTSDKTSIKQGDTLALAWEVADAQTITINGQLVDATGTWTVAPLTTTTYTLAASNAGCEPIEREITVTVQPLAITNITVTPAEVTSGEEAVLSWTLNDGFDPDLHRFVVDPDGIDVGNATSLTIATEAAGQFAYTVVAYDRIGSRALTPTAPGYTSSDRELTRSAPATLTVVEQPIIDAFNVEPLYVCGPAPVTITWQTRHASTVLINGQALAPAAAGAAQVNITSATPPLVLEAQNRLGYAVTAGPIPVTYYEIPTGTLTADHQTITAGQTTTLRWSAQHATSVKLDGQVVDATGTLAISPLTTTTYVLELVNGPECAPIRIERTIEVHQVEVTSFTADRADITRGESTTLRWSIANLDPALHKVTLHPLGLDVTNQANQVVSPLPPRERYTLTVHERNEPGRELATSDTVTVVVDEAPTVTSFEADPIGICGVGSTNLTWSTQHATRVLLDNVDVATNNPFGTLVQIDRTKTFTLRAENRLAYPDTAQVTVHHAPLPVVTFTVDKARIPEGDTITLTWSVVDADRVLLDGEPVDHQGSRTLTPREATTYRLVAEKDNAAGVAYECVTPAEVTVQVDPVSIKRFGLTTTTELTRGDTLSLPWELDGPFTPGIHTLTLDTIPTGGESQSVDVTSLTQLDVRPQVDTSYRLTLRGAIGQLLHQSAVNALVIDPPAITRFTATPQQVCEAGNVTLAWTATGAASAYLNGEPLGTPGGGTVTRSVTGLETFELEVRNSLGASAYAYQTVTTRPAPTATLEADRTSVPMGGEAKITWNAQHADEVLLNGQRVEPAGSLTITPTSAQTITLEARADGCAAVTRELTITPQPVTVDDLQATPSSVHTGMQATLSWAVTGYHPELHQAILEPSGVEVAGGKHNVRPRETTTYRVSVRLRANPETVLAVSQPVTVTAALEATIDALRVEPAYICAANQPLTLTWATRNAATVTLDGQSVPANGTRQVTGTTFTLKAANALGWDVEQTVTPLVALERSISFTADREQILRGESVTLQWAVTGAHDVKLDGQPVPLTGTLEVTPERTTTYRLESNTPNGATDCPTTHLVTIEVEDLQVESFTATPATIAAGGTSTLAWSTTSELDPEKHSLTLLPLGVDVTTLTERQVTATEPTSYWLELRDATGRLLSRSERVTLAIQGKPALTTAAVTPTEQCVAGNVTLTWSSVNAAHVLIDGVQRPAAGSLTQPVNGARQFTLTPVDSLGNTGNTETLLARVTSKPTLTLAADRTSVPRGETVTVTWDAGSAESVTLGGVYVPAQGSRTFRPDAATTYRLEAATGDCVVAQALTVTVVDVHIDAFAADKASITVGEDVTLTWSLTGFNDSQHTLTLYPTGEELEHDDEAITVSPTSSTQYVLRVTDQAGRVLAERRLANPVRVYEAPIITGFTADQLLVHGAADVTLRWGTRNATTLTLDGAAVTPREEGAATKRVTSERTFTLAATNPAGKTVTASVTVKQASLPTANLQAGKSRITAGATTTLTWIATGAQTLLNGAAVPATGNMSVAPTRTTTYTLEARDPSGEKATSSVTVTVDPVRVESLTADPTRVQAGDEIRLTWQVTPTFDKALHTLTLQPLGLDVTDRTTAVVEADASGTYQLVLTDKSGRELHRTQPGVTVTLEGEGAIASLTATAPTCAASQTRVAWVTRGASSVRLNGQALDANLTRRGAHTLAPAPAKVTLEALNAGGSVIDTREITLTAPNAPAVTQFRANRSAALAGQTATLEWNVTGAARVTIDGVEVPAQGTATVAVHETTTYTLHAVSADGCAVTERRTIEARHVSVEDLRADRTNTWSGQSVTLTWTYPVAPAAEHQVVLEGHGPLTRNGSTHPTSQVATPTATTTYSVAILDQHGRVLARSNTLTVTFEPWPEVVTFDATPIGVCGAGDVLLTWTTRNATRAYLEHRIAGNGSMRDVTTAYGATVVRASPGDELTLTAWTSYGDGASTLTIGGGQRPSIGFDVTPATRVAGQEATITWDVQGAKSVKLNGQPVAANGTLTDASHHTVTYRLEVEAEDCDPITLERVIHTESVHAHALTADRTHITDGDTTTLRWSLSDNFDPYTHKLVLEPLGQDVTNRRELDVTPSDTTTYSLRVTDKAGATLGTSPSVTITVEGRPAITRFDATPMQVCGAADVTFTWTTLNAARVLLNGTDVSPLSSGSTKVRVTQPGEYLLEAINPLGVKVTSEPLTIRQANRPTITFSADKTTVVDGEAVKLTWQITHAGSATLDGQNVATSGTLTVYPRDTTTYTLTANNPAAGIPCETTATVTVTVQPVSIQSFTLTPKDVTVGHDYQLAWTLSGTFNQALHIVQVDGGADQGTAKSLTRKADQSRTHTLTLRRRHDNSVIATRTAAVTVHAAPVIDTLTLTPAAICEGASSTLTWATRHANTITLNGQAVTASGTRTLNPTATTGYELIATNPAGTSVQRQATLTVHKRPVITFTTSKSNLVAGDKATLTWNVQNATAARLNGQSVPLTGSMEVDPLTTTTYTLSVDQTTCGTTTRQVTINVNPVGIQTLTAHPSVVTIPDTSELRWTLTSNYDPKLHTLELNRFEPWKAIGTVTGTSHTVTPDTPGYNGYELKILDGRGRTLATRQVEATGSLAPVITNLKADPASVCVAPGAAGTPVPITLTWSRSGEWTTALINGQAITGSELSNNRAVRNATGTTTFTLEARNTAYAHGSSRGATTASVSVPFTQVIDPTLTATKTRITAGDTLTLNWAAAGATVKLDGQAVNATGSQQVRPTTTTTYTLTAQTGDCAPITKTITVTVDPVTVDTFSADKTNVTSGDPVTLTWSLTRYTASLHKLVLEPLGTTVTGTSTTVHPTVTTTYRLRVDDNHGRNLARGPQVTVTANAAPAIESFTVNPQLVCGPSDVTLTWATKNATALRLNGQALTPIANGSTTRNVTGTTTFTLAALNAAGGSVTEAHTVTYVAPLQASLSSNKARMVRGDAATLTWSVAGAKSVTLDGQTVNATGTRQVTPTQTTTYTLVATSEHCGTITRKVTVEVDPVAITQFWLDNDHLLDEHGSFPRDAQPTLAWQTTGFDPELHALDLTTAAGKYVNLPGIYQVNIWSPRTYTHILTLYDKAENVLDQAQVQLTVQPAITGELPASSVCLPATVDLAWTVHDAQRYTVHQGTQLVVNVDRSPGVVTELVSRTVNLTNDQPVTLTYTATNPLGSTTTRSVTLRGAYPPELTLSATPAVAGAPVTVTWSIAHAPAGATIKLDGQTVPATGSTTYTIGKTARTHTLRIEGGPCGAYEKTLDVTPTLLTIPTFNVDKTTVTVGDPVQFTWSTNAHYDPTHHRLELSAPGQDVPANGNPAYDLKAATSLARTITKAAAHDYRLTIYSRHTGEQLATSTVRRVTGVQPPRIDTFTATPAQVCSTNPTSTLAWTTANATTRTLTGAGSVAASGSRAVTLTGATTYTLTAGNAAGTTVTRNVTVQYVTAPQITSFKAQGPSENSGYVTAGKSYTLTWTMTDPNAVPILNGVPRPAGTTSATFVAPNSPDPITHTLTLEQGPCVTEPTSLTVNPAVAPTAPRNPAASITGEQQVTVTWSAPTTTGNAPITNYSLQRRVNGGSSTTTSLPNGTTHVDITVLPGNTYEYRLAAKNAADLTGAYSAWSNAVTVIGVPGIPGTPTIQSRGDRSITIAWAPPTFNGGAPITSYQVERQASSDGSAWGAWSTVNAAHNGTTFTNTGLTAGTYYRYRVAATNQAGTGPASNPSASARAITLPGAPGKPTGQLQGNDTLAWQWAAPASDGYTPITSYKVQISSYDHASGTWGAWQAAGETTSRAHTANGFTAGQHQRIRVAATNSIGTGPYSQPSDPLWTLDVPARPDAPRITARGDHTLTLEVDPPDDGGTPILEYAFELHPLRNLARTATVTGPGILRPEVVNDGAKHVTNSSTAYSQIDPSTSAGPAGAEGKYFQLDLGNVRSVSGVVVYFYGYDARNYWYKVKVSEDGVNWTYAAGSPSGMAGWRESPASTSTQDLHPTTIALDEPLNARYVQVHVNGNSRNTGNHVYEIEVWGSPDLDHDYWSSDTNTFTTPALSRTNLARTATVSGTGLVEGYLVNDGDTSIQNQEYAYIGAGNGSDRGQESRYFELDLGASRTIYSVDTHFYSNDSRHYWYKVKVSNDGQNWTYLAGDSSNQGWVQTATSPGNPTAHPPTRVTAPWGTNARYVRVYGNGNSINTGNHVYEIEVWGDPEPNKPPRLMPGEWHAFQVAASNQVGWSDVSPLSVGAQVITTPSAPRNLSLNVDDNYMEVWWDYPATNGYAPIESFHLEYRHNEGGMVLAWKPLPVYANRWSEVFDLFGGDTYQFRVAAVNEAGMGEYAVTPWVRAIRRPDTPSAPTASVSGDRGVHITWPSAYGHGSSVTYDLQYQYSSNGGSSWSAWAAAAGNLSGTSYTHSGRTAGYHYRYRVLAKNQAGTSNPSAASNTLLVIGTPSEPRNFRVGTGPSSYQLQMGWSSPADNGGSAVTGYVIQRRTSTNGSTWSAWSTALNNTTAGNWTNTGLSGTTWYQYRVAARNAAGIGAYTAASPSVRPYYARTVRYAFGVTRMFCTYQASPQASSILGNNVWHRIQLVWPPFGLGCSAWLDLDIRWNNQEATPAPVCNMVADNQGGTFKQFQCEF